MAEPAVELSNLAAYLNVSCGKIAFDGKEKVPVLKAKNNSNIRGLVTVAKYLVRTSQEHTDLLGSSFEDGTAVDQWLEYRVTHIDKSLQEKDTTSRLKELNLYLRDKVYMVGIKLSLADILLYYGLHRLFSELSFYDKETYIHLSRWFDNIQHHNGLRQSLPILPFQRNRLYRGVSAH